MKVPGNEGSNKKGLADAIEDAKAGNVNGLRKGVLKNSGSEEGAAATGNVKADSVKVSNLASLLGQELNPSTLLAERRDKVERLKQLVNSGQYKPNLDSVAGAVGEELTLEILLGGGLDSKDDSLV